MKGIFSTIPFLNQSNPEPDDSENPKPDTLDKFGNLISKAPRTTFGVIVLITLILLGAMTGSLPFQEKSFNDNISTSIDQYIPEDTEEKRILDIVRENWATKVVIILVKTGNSYDTNCLVNITDRDVLEEISSVEGDDIYSGSNFARGDSGEQDYIEYILSLTALIKEINSSTPRMVNVLEEELATEMEEIFGSSVNLTEDDPYVEEQGKYAIPENQEQVDQIIAQIPNDVLTGFCADTNEDGIWDTAYSMLGAIEDAPDEEERDFIDHVIETRRVAQSDDDIEPYFSDDPNGPHHTWMIQTGLIAIMIDITEEANNQLAQTMPLAIGFVVAVMVIAHVFPGLKSEAGDPTEMSRNRWIYRLIRTFFSRLVKVIAIAGVPLFFTLIWTFGIMTMTNLEQSPIIVAAMPMLIGLSVDYSLHISNRITEFEEEGYTIKEGIRKTYHTTGVAVMLSAVTTMIGFAALFVAPLYPIRMLGLMLIVGIASAFFLSLTIVPCVVLIFHYRKPELAVWQRVARVPIKHRWHIIGVVLIITMISLANLSTMTETEEERQQMDTMGIDSLDAIVEFGEIWSEGSMSLCVLEPNEEAKQTNYQTSGALNDTEFLDQINWLEENFTSIEDVVDVEDVSAITIVDLFKSVALNISWTTVDGHIPDIIPGPIEDLLNPIIDPITGEVSEYYTIITYWDFIHLSDDEEFQKRSLRIFYNSLTQEARDMLMTPDYSMTLCMIRYPYTGRGLGEQIIDNINEDADNANNLVWEDGGETKYATLHSSKATSGQALSITIHEAIMETQRQTLILSLIFVFVALSLVFFQGSKQSQLIPRVKEGLRYAIITMIPVASVVAWQPLIMASVATFEGGASLNFMTAMISSVVIGAGIDFGVHITQRIREEGETLEGIQRAVQHTGQSIMEANLTTVAGLSGGLAVIWFRGFFSVLLLLLLYSMFAGMILLPSVYAVLAKRKGLIHDQPGTSEPGPLKEQYETNGSGLTDMDYDEDIQNADLIEDFEDEPKVEWELGD